MGKKKKKASLAIDWVKVVELLLISRAIDDLEERELVPQKKIFYQFSARGHELVQILVGMHLTDPNDAASAYYRSRPLLLTLGLSVEDAIASDMARSGGYSDGRDIGVVCNLPGVGIPKVLPMAGDVGSQYTPATGYAQAIEHRRTFFNDKKYDHSISVIFGGDGSVATSGFWSALTMATTLKLPVLFIIEDNDYGISVSGKLQTPGGNIAENLKSFQNLKVYDGDGTEPEEALQLISEATAYVRSKQGPALLRVHVPRLNGHSFQDNQAYKDDQLLEAEQHRDPLMKLKNLLIPEIMSTDDWDEKVLAVNERVRKDAERASERDEPGVDTLYSVYSGQYPESQLIGGLAAEKITLPEGTEEKQPETQRINIVEAVRRTLENELRLNDRLLVFGEDVGMKGGVHAATMGLQSQFGGHRVFDTSLSEEGIIGRSLGLAYGGFMPVAEIQFRKYADPATEQLKNAGTLRWRTANKYAAPMVVRMPGGFAKCGDPWHSESNEVFFARMPGWKVAYPSNAEDAAGLLRSAMRGNDPVIFFEHRNLLDSRVARRPYPGDNYVVPFGKANRLTEGSQVTIVTWGAMCERCEEAAGLSPYSVEVIDLRTVMPWDREMVFSSVKKTSRCLVVHEDMITAGFGSEIVSAITEELFYELDAPVLRLATADVPLTYNVGLMNHLLPDKNDILQKVEEVMSY
ncbi:MAG: pyruvate dehydrogenase [Balneolaceae bacterium]|nr:MAG: pyruvate dehydrogenase [Balneolaceae bacterium]